MDIGCVSVHNALTSLLVYIMHPKKLSCDFVGE